MQLRSFKAIMTTGLLLVSSVTLALDTTKPETVGFSSQRLQQLEQAMQAKIDSKELAGAVTLLARHGKIVGFNTYGYQDIASATPMKKDSIFRIYSMTKPITGVAMMILYEEGKWLPNDPIEKYIPEFKNLKVYAGQDKDGKPILENPKHPPTMAELMTHSAGISLGTPNSPVNKMYDQAKLFDSTSLKDLIDRISQLPLAYQPGEGWEYGMSTDVQGYLVERLSGMPFPQFLQERIFQPLGMMDTGFFVPENKRSRLATIYRPDENMSLVAMPHDPNLTKMPAMPSGGGGLYSTAEDYFRFMQMLLDNGASKGAQILSPSTVKLMRSNHLADQLKTGKYGIGWYHMQPGFGFGYDMAVIEDPLKIGSTAGAGSFLWDGLAGTWFWADPSNDVIFIGLIQRWGLAPGMPNLEDMSRALVYQALITSNK